MGDPDRDVAGDRPDDQGKRPRDRRVELLQRSLGHRWRQAGWQQGRERG